MVPAGTFGARGADITSRGPLVPVGINLPPNTRPLPTMTSPIGAPPRITTSNSGAPPSLPEVAGAPAESLIPPREVVGTPPLITEKVGGCLGSHWRAWERISRDPWVPQVLKEGYQLPFREGLPPLSHIPISFSTYPHNSPQFQALELEVADLLKKGAVSEAPLPLSPGFYARIFVVPKGDLGVEWRPIIDLSSLNKFVSQTPFKMETSRSVLRSVRRGDFLITLDLQDAYLQVPVHPHSSRYLRFVWQGKTLQFRTLCFGLSTAPQVFTRVCAVVSAHLHSHGIRLLRYLDDWLLLAPSLDTCLAHKQVLLDLWSSLGL